MLQGDRVVLRDLRRADVEARWREEQDPYLHSLTDSRPWEPETLEAALARFDKRLGEPRPGVVPFAVSRRDDPDEACIGGVQLWGLDEHHRFAHLGIGLTAEVRGQGLGREVLGLACRYAFEVRDLVRVQLETLDVNAAMRGAAEACGFTLEGRLRQNAYLMGERQDELIYGLLRDEWAARR